MNLHDYDWSRLIALGYPADFAEKMKDDPCWKGYEMVGMKKKRGRSVPNCVPIKKSDHAEEMKHKPLIAGPSAGSPSFAERGKGKPCGDSHIAASKKCKVEKGSDLQRDSSKDVKRGNTLIGTSGRNMSIDNLNSLKKEYEDYKRKFGHRDDLKHIMDGYEKRISDMEKFIQGEG